MRSVAREQHLPVVPLQTGGSLDSDHSDATAFSSDFMETKPIDSVYATPAYVWLVQLFAAYAAYITGKDPSALSVSDFRSSAYA